MDTQGETNDYARSCQRLEDRGWKMIPLSEQTLTMAYKEGPACEWLVVVWNDGTMTFKRVFVPQS